MALAVFLLWKYDAERPKKQTQKYLLIALGGVLEAELVYKRVFLDLWSWVALPDPSKFLTCGRGSPLAGYGTRATKSQHRESEPRIQSSPSSPHQIWMRTLLSGLGPVVLLPLPLRSFCNLTHFYPHTSLGMQSLQEHRTERNNSGKCPPSPIKEKRNKKKGNGRLILVCFMSKSTG